MLHLLSFITYISPELSVFIGQQYLLLWNLENNINSSSKEKKNGKDMNTLTDRNTLELLFYGYESFNIKVESDT